jgi:hypothetical protein
LGSYTLNLISHNWRNPHKPREPRGKYVMGNRV